MKLLKRIIARIHLWFNRNQYPKRCPECYMKDVVERSGDLENTDESVYWEECLVCGWQEDL